MHAHGKLRFGSVHAYGGRAIADALLPHSGVHRKIVRFNALNLEISESVWHRTFQFCIQYSYARVCTHYIPRLSRHGLSSINRPRETRPGRSSLPLLYMYACGSGGRLVSVFDEVRAYDIDLVQRYRLWYTYTNIYASVRA